MHLVDASSIDVNKMVVLLNVALKFVPSIESQSPLTSFSL